MILLLKIDLEKGCMAEKVPGTIFIGFE